MDTQQIVDAVHGFEGSLVVAPEPGSDFLELSWGDSYFYYAPDAAVPERTQPYGTIVTKDYPEDEVSELDKPNRFRVNVHVGRDRVTSLTAQNSNPAAVDTFFPHPLYRSAGWVSVVDPAEKTAELVISFLREAHDAARERSTRRG